MPKYFEKVKILIKTKYKTLLKLNKQPKQQQEMQKTEVKELKI